MMMMFMLLLLSTIGDDQQLGHHDLKPVGPTHGVCVCVCVCMRRLKSEDYAFTCVLWSFFVQFIFVRRPHCASRPHNTGRPFSPRSQ